MHPAGAPLDVLSFINLTHFRNVHACEPVGQIPDPDEKKLALSCHKWSSSWRVERRRRDSWNLRKGNTAEQAEFGTSPVSARDPTPIALHTKPKFWAIDLAAIHAAHMLACGFSGLLEPPGEKDEYVGRA